jgi:hypothetical protein
VAEAPELKLALGHSAAAQRERGMALLASLVQRRGRGLGQVGVCKSCQSKQGLGCQIDVCKQCCSCAESNFRLQVSYDAGCAE